MEVSNKYIRFDWAVKRMLRDKANFAVLEGLITVLTGEKVTIAEILESEGNQESAVDKFNRVDIKAKNERGDIMVQNDVLDTAKMEGRAEGRIEGRAEGRVEGRAEGRTEEKIEMAKKMKAMGMAIETISHISGLTAEQIEQL